MCLSTGEADVFNKYKDDKGNFKENLTKDVKGLLSLYEASYLSVHGEIILDEALVFTETHLKWWKELDFTTKLPFARDRLIIVVLGLFSEPQYALARQILTKSTMLVSVLDDINDVHGTIEELEQFTKMIERYTRLHPGSVIATLNTDLAA
uniref:Uncharacterized protein n=1 Tax=Populus alba TaxID=43335 RepID=A0A4U5R349_POPAL|nr:hypothetical protein D5086_0000006330 [Populus alba]